MYTLKELKEKIEQEFDPDLICEMLYITTADLLEAFEDRLLEPDITKKFNWVIEEDKDE